MSMSLTPPEVSPTSRYSITAAAEKLGVSRQTVHNYINSKKIKMKVQYFKINNRPFVTGLEIMRVWNAAY